MTRHLAKVVDEARGAEQVDGADVVDAHRVVVVAVDDEHRQPDVVIRVLEVRLPVRVGTKVRIRVMV